MEEIKKLLEQNEDFLLYLAESGSDNESSTACDLEKYKNEISMFNSFNTKITENKLTTKKRNGKERLPTRRPDPTVYNRNALLARENRKKKKIYLETIEKELQQARKANGVLLKALKHQMKMRRHLEKEKIYFERLIEERCGILGLNKRRSMSGIETNKSYSVSNSFESLHFLDSENGCEISRSGSIYGGETGSICIDSTSDDLENDVDSCTKTTFLNWDDICINNGNKFDNVIKGDSIKADNNILHDVNNDHSYFTSLSGLKVPEEKLQILESFNVSRKCSCRSHEEFYNIFCPTCGVNQDCRTPPQQLLNEEL